MRAVAPSSGTDESREDRSLNASPTCTEPRVVSRDDFITNLRIYHPTTQQGAIEDMALAALATN